MTKKSATILLVLVLVLSCAVGSTLAWLTDSTEEVKNTFTTSDINITLVETTTDYQMVPGYTIAKDPKITVEADSEACFLFVKIEESTNFGTYMTYDVADGWTALDGVAGVYYREVTASDADQVFEVLDGNKVVVKGEVTKAMMAEAETTKPTLTFTAYASQAMKNNTEKFTAKEAWDNVNPTQA